MKKSLRLFYFPVLEKLPQEIRAETSQKFCANCLAGGDTCGKIKDGMRDANGNVPKEGQRKN